VIARAALLAGLVGLAACGDGGGFPDAAYHPPPLPGMFTASWTITQGGAAATCAQVNATSVLARIVDATSGSDFSTTFACSLGSAVSGALAPSTYNVTYTLLNGSAVLGTATMVGSVTISSNMTTAAPAVVFALP